MADEQTLGNIIDGLGVSVDIQDGELIADAIVMVKVIGEDGDVGLRTGWSTGMSWIERVGMLQVCKVIEDADTPNGLVE